MKFFTITCLNILISLNLLAQSSIQWEKSYGGSGSDVVLASIPTSDGGYLLGANPRKQFLAQFAGIFFGTIAIVPVWYLMVPTKAALEKFPAPATNQWARVAQVLTEGIDKLPMSAQYAIIIGALVGIILPVGERLIPQSARKFWPSAMGFGLSWVLPFANAFAFMIGAIIAFIWEKINKRTADVFTVPIASGLVAGESLIKAIIAMTATVIGLLGWDK